MVSFYLYFFSVSLFNCKLDERTFEGNGLSLEERKKKKKVTRKKIIFHVFAHLSTRFNAHYRRGVVVVCIIIKTARRRRSAVTTIEKRLKL